MLTSVVVNSSWDLRLQDLEDISLKGEVRHKTLVLYNGIDKITANRMWEVWVHKKKAAENKVDCLFLNVFLPA